MCPEHYFYWSVSVFITLNEYLFNFLSHLWAHFVNVRIILASLWVLNTPLILVSSANLMIWLITALCRPLNKIENLLVLIYNPVRLHFSAAAFPFSIQFPVFLSSKWYLKPEGRQLHQIWSQLNVSQTYRKSRCPKIPNP